MNAPMCQPERPQLSSRTPPTVILNSFQHLLRPSKPFQVNRTGLRARSTVIHEERLNGLHEGTHVCNQIRGSLHIEDGEGVLVCPLAKVEGMPQDFSHRNRQPAALDEMKVKPPLCATMRPGRLPNGTEGSRCRMKGCIVGSVHGPYRIAC